MMGRLALAFNKLEIAEEYFRKSLDILPDVLQRRFIYSNVLRMLNRNEEALVEIDRCLEATPEDYVILKGRAVVLSLLGRSSEATALYLKLLIEAPDRDKPYYNLAVQHKFTRGDEFSEVFDELSKSINELEPEGARKSAQFALGKYFDDLKDYGTAFHHYQQGNEIQRRLRGYDLEKDISNLSSLTVAFPKNGLWLSENGRQANNFSEFPVFIVGMPRSGTTLVEQILASHPEVIGLGETFSLGTSAARLNQIRVDGEELLPKSENSLVEFRKLAADLGKEIIDKMEAQASDAKRAIDKMPQNFLYIGHLHLMFPRAKIIHVKRNPIDTCVSNFCANFESSLDYSNDLDSLGQYYVAYNGLMQHWKELLPDNILEIQYEEVVADLEKNARRMLEFIDLEWDDRCLKFYEHTRSVNTASFDQVRQPMYKTSVGRYERYGDLLKPLLDELKPVLP